MKSYYDAIGLLAICDAIDSVEGIPLSSLSSHPPPPSSSRSPSKPPSPPKSNSQTPNLGPISTNNKPFLVPTDSTQCLYPYPPEPTPGTTAPIQSQNLLTPYNYDSVGMDTSSSSRAYPMFYAQPLQHNPQDDSYYQNSDEKFTDHPIYTPHASAQVSISARNHSIAKSTDSYSQRKREQRNSRKLSTSISSDQSALKLSEKPYYNKQALSPSQPETNGRPSIMIGGYKVEECHICGRKFKGPKASTHKQQHIRRLHPEDYTPKRGGKKRTLMESPV